MPDVYLPTGTCFDDCAEAFEDAVRKHPELAMCDNFVIVHGVMHAIAGEHDETVEAGEPFAHAWLEVDGIILHPAINPNGEKVMTPHDKETWYAKNNITDFTRYPAWRILEENLKHGHVGPWEERYKTLCKKGTA